MKLPLTMIMKLPTIVTFKCLYGTSNPNSAYVAHGIDKVITLAVGTATIFISYTQYNSLTGEEITETDTLKVTVLAPPVIDGILSLGEWDAYFWFTDNSEGPGTGYDDAPLPVFSGYVTNDDEYLYVAMKVEDPAPQSSRGVHLYIDMPIMGVFNDPDVQHFVISPGNVTGYSYGESTGDSYPWNRKFVTDTLPEGVEIASSYDEGNGIGVYEFKIPLTVFGSNPGDTIGLEFQATDNPGGWNYNFYPDVPGDITPIYTSLRVEVDGLYAPLNLIP